MGAVFQNLIPERGRKRDFTPHDSCGMHVHIVFQNLIPERGRKPLASKGKQASKGGRFSEPNPRKGTETELLDEGYTPRSREFFRT